MTENDASGSRKQLRPENGICPISVIRERDGPKAIDLVRTGCDRCHRGGKTSNNSGKIPNHNTGEEIVGESSTTSNSDSIKVRALMPPKTKAKVPRRTSRASATAAALEAAAAAARRTLTALPTTEGPQEPAGATPANAGSAEQHSTPTTAKKRRTDRRVTWAPGQWDAWQAFHAVESQANATKKNKRSLKEITEAFNAVERKQGWQEHDMDAIRSMKRRMGAADGATRGNRLTDTDRARALALFDQHGKNWSQATAAFNAETGRTLTKGALVQAVRRKTPALPPDLQPATGTATFAQAPWSDAEIQALKKFTNHVAQDKMITSCSRVKCGKLTRITSCAHFKHSDPNSTSYDGH